MMMAAVLTALFALGPVATASADPDITPPVVTITGYPADNETAGTFVFSADEPVQGYECQLDTDPWVACITPTFVLGLAQGPHDFRVRATDLASNVGDPPTVYSWIVDTETPAIPVISVPTSGTWTNDNLPTISGTAEAFVSVRVFDGTDLLGTTSADSLGDWTFTPSAPLLDGSYSIRVRARDAATNESAYSPTRTLYVDTVAPAAPTITDPNEAELTNAADLAFAGATEPFATVAVSVDAQTPEVATANSAGQWSLDPASPPADGPHAVTATATDRAGNEGAASAPVNFELESVPPPQPVILTPTDPTAQADDSITFTGTAEALAAITLLDGSTEVAVANVDALGDWNVTFNLADGVYDVVAVATDEHGNESPPSTAVELTIDTTGPTTTVISGPPEFTNATDADFEFVSNEPSVTHECSFDMTYWEACTSVASFTGRPPGPNEFAVRGTDSLGNIGAPSATYAWEIDLDPPAAPTITSPTSPTLTNDVRAPIVGTAEPHASVELMIESAAQTGSLGTATADGTTGDWEFTPTVNLPQGELQITAVATDRAGNAGVASAPLEITVDSVAPTTTIGAGPPFASVRSQGASFVADEAGVTFTCSLDGAAPVTCASPFVANDLSFGVHSFSVRGTDAAGNVEAVAKTVSRRVAMIDTPFGLNPKCSFERIRPEAGVKVSLLRTGTVRRGRQAIRFTADSPGIARVSLLRRNREISQVSLAVKKGGNVARLRVKRILPAGAPAELVIAAVSTLGSRTLYGQRVLVAAGGRAIPTKKKLRAKRTRCAKPRGARATNLRVLSTRRAADALVVRVRSSHLALATIRVSDEYSFSQSPVKHLKAGRSGTIVVALPPGLGANPATTRVFLTAFNTAYARAQAELAFPAG